MKKLLTLVLALAMLLALAIPAMADGPSVTTSLDKDTGEVTITITDGESNFTGTTQYTKNGSETIEIGGYNVAVDFNGNGVKSASIVSSPVYTDETDPVLSDDEGEPTDEGNPVDEEEFITFSTIAGRKIYLKGSGSDFTDEWNNVFYLGGAAAASDPSVWHIVYTGKDMSAITGMQLDFGVNGTWTWTTDMGFSTNLGGNNSGWVVIAPADWAISYINKGNNNESDSFVTTTESGNPQFNISGFHQGTPDNPGNLNTSISFNKFMGEYGVDPDEVFTFDALRVDSEVVIKTASNAPGSSLVEFVFDTVLEAGNYIIRERVPTGYKPVGPLYFTVNEAGEAAFVDDVNHIINVKYGALEVTDDVVEEYFKEYHKPVYKMYTYGTLVSWANTLGDDGAVLPEGFTGNFLDNGMTYLKINKAALAAMGEAGATIGIAESNKPNGSINSGWNTPVAGKKTYNLKIVDDKLIVTSDLPGFGAAVYSENTVKGPQDIKHNAQAAYEIKTDSQGNFWFFFHIGSASYHLGEIIGCEFDYEKGPFERLYAGEVTMTVLDAEGTQVYAGALGLVGELLAGDYTVTIFAGDVELASKTVTVFAGDTTNADFDKLIVPELGDPVIICNQCNPEQ